MKWESMCVTYYIKQLHIPSSFSICPKSKKYMIFGMWQFSLVLDLVDL